MKDRSLRSSGHVSPEGICRVVLELSVDHFAEAGRDELIGWGMGSSRELGELIHELADQGAIVLSEADEQAAFRGWYDLQRDPSTWELKW